MPGEITRRDTLIASLIAPLPLSGDHGPSLSLQSIAFVTTLQAARRERFGSTIGLVVLGGYTRPGDAGAGQVMVRDLFVDSQRASRDPTSAFIDQAGTGFSRAPDIATSTLREGPLIDWLIARIDRFGVDPLSDLRPRDADAAPFLQAAFDAAIRQDTSAPAITRLPRGHWRIDSPLTLDGRHASLIGQGISITYLHSALGAGQTAMTLRNYGGDTSAFCLDSGLPGSSAKEARTPARNGILFDWSGGHGSIRSVEVRRFNGFGMRFVTVWDSIIENIITVGCGNDAMHAVEFLSIGDTTNHSNVNRLQVEDSEGRAILFDATCMNMCVDNIHCEGTVGKPGQYAVSLLGTAMSFRSGRIANDGGNVEVLLGGAGNVYDRFSFETGVRVDYATGAAGRSERSFISHSIFDRLRILDSNRGALVVSDCTIEQLELADQMRSVTFVRCIIGDVWLRGNQTDVAFEDCDINGSWTSEGNPVVRVRDGRLNHGPAAALVYLTSCTIRNNYTSMFNQQVQATDCTFGGDVILANNGARIWLFGRCTVAGDLAYRAGNAFGACSLDASVVGSVHGNWYGTGGTWPVGTLRARLNAGKGDSPYTRFDGQNWSSAPLLL